MVLLPSGCPADGVEGQKSSLILYFQERSFLLRGAGLGHGVKKTSRLERLRGTSCKEGFILTSISKHCRREENWLWSWADLWLNPDSAALKLQLCILLSLAFLVCKMGSITLILFW